MSSHRTILDPNPVNCPQPGIPHHRDNIDVVAFFSSFLPLGAVNHCLTAVYLARSLGLPDCISSHGHILWPWSVKCGVQSRPRVARTDAESYCLIIRDLDHDPVRMPSLTRMEATVTYGHTVTSALRLPTPKGWVTPPPRSTGSRWGACAES